MMNRQIHTINIFANPPRNVILITSEVERNEKSDLFFGDSFVGDPIFLRCLRFQFFKCNSRQASTRRECCKRQKSLYRLRQGINPAGAGAMCQLSLPARKV